MNDHTPTPDELHDSELTAYALGELEPGSDRFVAVEARLVEDEDARAFVKQTRAVADELARQFARGSAAGEGLAQDQREAVLAAASPRPTDHLVAGAIRPRPLFSRKALLAAGIVLAAGAAITSAVLLNDNSPADNPPVATDTPVAPTGPLEVIDRMNKPIDSDYSATPLRDALATLQQQTHTPIDIDWDALHQRGIDPDTPITFKADDAPAAAVLAMILQRAWKQSPHPDPIIWTVADTGLRVEPRSAAVERRLTASRDAIATSNPRITTSRAELFDLTPTLADVLPEVFVLKLTPMPVMTPVTQESVQAELDALIALNWEEPTEEQINLARGALWERKVALAHMAIQTGQLNAATRLSAEAALLSPGGDTAAQRQAEVQTRLTELEARFAEADPTEVEQFERNAEIQRRYQLAQRWKQVDDYRVALAELEGAQEIAPDSPEVRELRGSLINEVAGSEGFETSLALGSIESNHFGVDRLSAYDGRYDKLQRRDGEGLIPGPQPTPTEEPIRSLGIASERLASTDAAKPSDSEYRYNIRGLDAAQPQAQPAARPGNDFGWQYNRTAGDFAGRPAVELDEKHGRDFRQAPSFDLNDALSNPNSGGTNQGGRGGGQGGLFGDDESDARDADELFEHAAQVNRGRPLALPDIEGLNLDDIRLPDPVTPGDIYAIVHDNPFHMVFEQQLSTFSVDVDTAGYSITRRQLLQYGSLPQPEHVRIEEMINYFDYTYEAPQVDARKLADGVVTQATIDQLEAADPDFAPFATHTEVTDCPWAEGHKLVRVGIKGEVAMEDRPQSHLTFLIDVSGSMNRPDKLGLVQQSLKLLLDQLNPDDKVSLVVYAGASGLVLEPTAVADRNKIVDAIDNLRAGGGTAGAAGIQLAYQIAKDHFVDGGVNRVILCTDGDFNVGISDTDDLVALVKDKANPVAGEDGVKRGVYLSAMGFGMGNLNDQMMELITNAGNGNYAYIDSLQEATKVMYDQAGATLVTIAKDVKIQVDFDPAQVLSYRLIGYENRILKTEDFEDDKVDAGDIGAGHTVTALYEVVPFDANWQDNNDGPAVHNRVKQLKDAIAMNGTLLQTTQLTEEQQLKLVAATGLLQQELKQATALSQRLAMNAPGRTNGVKRGPERVGQAEPMLVVNLRYKPVDAPAEDGTSRLIEHPVGAEAIPFDQASEDMRFATSVAGLGMALRKSPHFAGGSYGWIIDTAKAAATHDPHGYRAQFITLAEKARELSGDVSSEPADEAGK